MDLSLENLWTTYSFKETEVKLWQLHNISLWVKRGRGYWKTGCHTSDGNERPSQVTQESAPEDLEWEKHYVHNDGVLRLVPLLPDKPVVIRPESIIKILPHEKVQFFLPLPIIVGIQTERVDESVTLREIPFQKMPFTWFGETDTGELCYSFATPLNSNFSELEFDLGHAVCVLKINNDSPSSLDFHRLCIRAEHLRLYQGPKSLWTNEVIVHFKGPEQWSQVDFADSVPYYEKVNEGHYGPRRPVGRNFVKKSFELIKSIYNI
jgi:hypothetical protein